MKRSFVDCFADMDSPLHILEARTKLLGFSMLFVSALFIPTGRDYLFFAYFFVTVILMGISQIPLWYIIGRALLIVPLVLLMGLATLEWNRSGFAELIALLLRAVLCIIFLILMVNTTRFDELLRGLRRLGCPRFLLLKCGFYYRCLFLLREELLRMRRARMNRSAGHASFKLVLSGSALGTMLERLLEHARSMHQAMLCRGHTGDFPVFSMRRFTWHDVAFLGGIVVFLGAMYSIGLLA